MIAIALGAPACVEGDPTPEEVCRSFVDVYCDRAVECAMPTDRSRVAMDCPFYFAVNAPCEGLREAPSNAAYCPYEAKSVTCAPDPQNWPAIPFSCRWLVDE